MRVALKATIYKQGQHIHNINGSMVQMLWSNVFCKGKKYKTMGNSYENNNNRQQPYMHLSLLSCHNSFCAAFSHACTEQARNPSQFL